MKFILLIIIAITICLWGCKKQEPVDNLMLLRGEAGRLWLLSYSEQENSQYLWFDQYGQCQVLEFGIKEPNLVIPDVNVPSNMDSCFEIEVFLDGLPYRMFQFDEGWVGPEANEIIEDESLFTQEEKFLGWNRIYSAWTKTLIC